MRLLLHVPFWLFKWQAMFVLSLSPVLTETASDLDSKIDRVIWSIVVSDYRRQELARGSILQTLLHSSKT